MNFWKDQFDESKYSGLSKVNCSLCKNKILTKAQLKYSLKYFNKPLCLACQRLEKYLATH